MGVWVGECRAWGERALGLGMGGRLACDEAQGCRQRPTPAMHTPAHWSSQKKIPSSARPNAMSAEPMMPPCSTRIVYCGSGGRQGREFILQWPEPRSAQPTRRLHACRGHEPACRSWLGQAHVPCMAAARQPSVRPTRKRSWSLSNVFVAWMLAAIVSTCRPPGARGAQSSCCQAACQVAQRAVHAPISGMPGWATAGTHRR